MTDKNSTRQRVPTIFFTNVRKVEPMGSDCIRIYCSVEQNGSWTDRVCIEMPIKGALEASKFVTEAAADIEREMKAGAAALERMLVKH